MRKKIKIKSDSMGGQKSGLFQIDIWKKKKEGKEEE